MTITKDLLDALNIDTVVKRREFLKTGAIVATAAQLWMPTVADAKAFTGSGRVVQIHNAHTGETFDGEYWADGKYHPDAFREIKKIFRDHRSGDIFPIDPRLIDVMYVLHNRAESNKAFRLFSGYRSPATNRKLRKLTSGVAEKSLHMLGQAVDLRLPGTNLHNLRKAAINLKAGGVGYYPDSHFLHLDTGRVRHW
jgi:uncharacterized protein YcbK (DUF882 family)